MGIDWRQKLWYLKHRDTNLFVTGWATVSPLLRTPTAVVLLLLLLLLVPGWSRLGVLTSSVPQLLT